MRNNKNTDAFEKNNNSSGLKYFVSLIIAIIAICAVVIGIAYHDKNSTKSNKSQSSKGASSSVTIHETPDYKKEPSSSKDRLNSVEVANKASKSVIAVVAHYNGKLDGEGSGIVMKVDSSKKSAYIITCAHIVDKKGQKVYVQTKDKKRYEATIVGVDSRTDIAVLKVNNTDDLNLTPAEFGDSSKLKVGETIYAIGNPGGTAFYGSFTSGVVSAIDRITPAGKSGYSVSCIQHDAAINPGNSGGALVNEFGQVVGINSSKIADTEYEGMGFAIPMTVAKDIIDKIISNGYVPNRPKIGIRYAPINFDNQYVKVAKQNKLPQGSIVIAEIVKDGSLHGTQAKVGDIIYAVNGKDLNKDDTLLNIIENSKVGDELDLSMCHVNDDYSVNRFNVKVKLLEDKGN